MWFKGTKSKKLSFRKNSATAATTNTTGPRWCMPIAPWFWRFCARCAMLLALGFAVYVRAEIRVDENGQAGILGPQKPSLLSRRVRQWSRANLRRGPLYGSFSNVISIFLLQNANWADSLNMMTANLRRNAFGGMQKE